MGETFIAAVRFASERETEERNKGSGNGSERKGGREPASCQRYVTNKFVIYVYIILHGVGLCVCVSSV